ncbi:MAG: hypothetical protein KGD61_01075, partial [Candidatus Lokiarchaeota archaeon]|nr:hypothetical protein [Candidatus Lokiarchaeota archaeon]
MNDLPRDKFEILDIIFTFLIASCMALTAIFLLYNLIVSILYVIVVVLFAFVVLFLWFSRNPFIIYLVRAFAFNNFILTFITIVIFFSKFSPATSDYPGYILLLVPSGIYLLISYKFSAVTTLSDKKEGAMLAMAGKTKASELRLFRDNPEERIKREDFIAKQKEVYKYKT